MAVERIQIVPSSGKEIAFDGELIAHATSERATTSFGERWFELRIYKLVQDGLVPVIEYHSTVNGEEQITIAERVDRSQDVENFFYVFEPCEVVPETAMKMQHFERRQRLTKFILKQYDTQVNRVLLQAKEHMTDDDPEDSKSPKPKRGLLRFFSHDE